MKSTPFGFFLIFCLFNSSNKFVYSQDGLEGIILEKFYISSKEDNSKPELSGYLAPGSITYRIHVDLKPGYTFQAAYGAPNHQLYIKSTNLFYNHVEYGAEYPNRIPLRTYSRNTSRLDSWLSVGGAGENQIGVLKLEDDTLNVFKTSGAYLKNQSKKMGVSLEVVDGMKEMYNLTFPTFYQMDSTIKGLGTITNTNKIITNNGAWASMGKGSQGADSLSNKVLIAQLTTDGKLSYQLNLLIGTPDGKSEKYVAHNPIEGEFTHPDLYFVAKKIKKRIF
jgi:hypothetical protein